jgi:hypothetical protein
MPTSEQETAAYAETHKASATRLLNKYASKDSKLFTILRKEYQRSFDLMSLTSLKKFEMVYQSRRSRGIGEHRGRLKRIIHSIIENNSSPILFRSGCGSSNEIIGFQQGNQNIGTSLAYIDRSNLKQYITDIIKKRTGSSSTMAYLLLLIAVKNSIMQTFFHNTWH